MKHITINNYGTVNIYNVNDTSVADAKCKLLDKLFHAKDTTTMTLTNDKRDGRAAWLKLLDMYHSLDYQGMYDYIKSCKHKGGGKTRHDCLKLLEIIMKEGTN